MNQTTAALRVRTLGPDSLGRLMAQPTSEGVQDPAYALWLYRVDLSLGSYGVGVRVQGLPPAVPLRSWYDGGCEHNWAARRVLEAIDNRPF